MTKDTVQLLEENIRRAKEQVETHAALARLQQNRDFQRVVLGGYLKDEAVRLVHLRVDPAMQTPERQASVLRQIDGIGCLLDYFRTLELTAANAEKSIALDEMTREDLLAEGAE